MDGWGGDVADCEALDPLSFPRVWVGPAREYERQPTRVCHLFALARGERRPAAVRPLSAGFPFPLCSPFRLPLSVPFPLYLIVVIGALMGYSQAMEVYPRTVKVCTCRAPVGDRFLAVEVQERDWHVRRVEAICSVPMTIPCDTAPISPLICGEDRAVAHGDWAPGKESFKAFVLLHVLGVDTTVSSDTIFAGCTRRYKSWKDDLGHVGHRATSG